MQLIKSPESSADSARLRPMNLETCGQCVRYWLLKECFGKHLPLGWLGRYQDKLRVTTGTQYISWYNVWTNINNNQSINLIILNWWKTVDYIIQNSPQSCASDTCKFYSSKSKIFFEFKTHSKSHSFRVRKFLSTLQNIFAV